MTQKSKIKTAKINLLCGFIEENKGVERKDAEDDEAYHARRFTLHKECVVQEMDHDLDRDLANRDLSAVDLLARHLISVGSITDSDRIKEEVAPKLLKGDYDYAMLRMRMLSLGPVYRFELPCPKKKSCVDSKQELDLEGIELVDMPDPWARKLEYTTEDGVELVFRHLEAADIDILSEILEDQEDEIRQVLGLKLVSINGKSPSKSLKSRGRTCKTPEQFVREAVRMIDSEKLVHRVKEDIRKKLEKMVGLPKLIFKAKCPICRGQWMQRVQIGPSFFLTSSEED